jgi:hypothetical protein
VPRGGAGDSGDAWAVAIDPSGGSRLAALIVDGLGHGPAAAEAATAAIAAFERLSPAELSGTWLSDLTRKAHQAMHGTRGGVFGGCVIDPDAGRVTYLGIGNTTGRVLAAQRGHHLIGRHGTLGTQLRPPTHRPTSYPWPTGATLVLATDGIDGHWPSAAYRETLRHHPAVVAATIHRDHCRGTDDAAVLVVQDTRVPGDGR